MKLEDRQWQKYGVQTQELRDKRWDIRVTWHFDGSVSYSINWLTSWQLSGEVCSDSEGTREEKVERAKKAAIAHLRQYVRELMDDLAEVMEGADNG